MGGICAAASCTVAKEEARQRSLGPQSYRGGADRAPMERLNGHQSALDLFDTLFQNEDEHHGKYAVFYHSYSHAALLYEVRAAAAALIHDYPGLPAPAPLPRLQMADFKNIPDAAEVINRVKTQWGVGTTKSDHNPDFRKVCISTMCSLLATGPECCMQVAFFEGYSCKKIAFRAVLEEELRSVLLVPEGEATALVDELMELAAQHGLDASILGGKPSPSGHAGHILQIFIRRDIVDRICYPAKPYGEVDEDRLPFSKWINGEQSFSWGQARILAHPQYFMNGKLVKVFAISADPTFQAGRPEFHSKLKAILGRSSRVPRGAAK